MKKKPRKLALNKETLQNLGNDHLRGVLGGGVRADDTSQSIQSGETYCWCSQTCNGCCPTDAYQPR